MIKVDKHLKFLMGFQLDLVIQYNQYLRRKVDSIK